MSSPDDSETRQEETAAAAAVCTSGLPAAEEMDDARAIKDVARAISLCLNNKFNEAEELLKPWSHVSMYHALGCSSLKFAQALMTNEEEAITTAIDSAKNTLKICEKRRKKLGLFMTVSNAITGHGLHHYTTEELHSELVHAESLLQNALLSFIQNDNLISFIKGALKIRSCYQSYKACWSLINSDQPSAASNDLEFISGVRFGLGCFSLMISLLPGRILKLLQFIGFSGNRGFGMDQLQAVSATQTLRSPFSSISVLNFDLIITHIFGIGDGNVERCEAILERCLQEYPKGAVFLLYAGRVKYVRGFVEEAISLYKESIDVQSQWIQIHHTCYWELTWAYSLKGDWVNAAHFSDLLCRESDWSKATFLYQKAAFVAMLKDFREPLDELVVEMLQDVPRYKQRIAGYSIPMEKFVIKKSEKCLAQGNRLMLPGLELVYIWNGFMVLAQCPELLEAVSQRVDAAFQYVQSDASASRLGQTDDLCLVQLLRGVCLRGKGKLSDAEQCFQEVISRHKLLTVDKYLAPYAEMELGMLYIKKQEFDKAKEHLLSARSNYTKFSLESRLHMRVHSALAKVKDCEADTPQ